MALGAVYSHFALEEWWIVHFDMTLCVFSIFGIYLAVILLVRFSNSASPRGRANIAFASLVILSIPAAVAGALTLMAWEQTTRMSSWGTLMFSLVPICAYCWIIINQKTTAKSPATIDAVRSIVIASAVLIMCPSLLERGNGYLVTILPPIIAWIDIAVHVSSIIVQV